MFHDLTFVTLSVRPLMVNPQQAILRREASPLHFYELGMITSNQDSTNAGVLLST